MLQTKNIQDQSSDKAPQNKGFLTRSLNGRKQVIEVDEFLTMGRSAQAHLCLEDEFISQRHARIERKGGIFFIRDLNSRNGTALNGVQICEAILRDGDEILLGKTLLSFHFERGAEKENLVTASKNPAWRMQLEKLPSIAESGLPVLILGESGTGKELITQFIHRKSLRSQGPLICVNCSALGDSLIESELFGHVRGSFTGATHDRKGAFESARGGTLFLDEIGDLPLSLQPKLLRAIENQEIRPVGSDKTIKTNVRIVAATHQNLKAKVQSGQFRADLYFRLHIAQIQPPPLRNRMEDFESLAYYFCKKERVRLSFEAIQKLKSHSWPGNIRELKNCISRARALFKSEEIKAEHVQELIDYLPPVSLTQILENHPQSIREMEKKLIVESLIRNQGNQRKTAHELGIPKSTLHDRVKSYEIDLEDFKR